MRRNIGALLAQPDTGQSELDDKIMKKVLSYEKLDDQLFALTHLYLGCVKPKDFAKKSDVAICNQVNEMIFKDFI